VHFTLEQAVVMRLFADNSARGAGSISGRAMVRLVQRQPMTGYDSVRCIIALCFLFKKWQSDHAWKVRNFHV
jgi:hypothetical protein